MPPTPLPRGGGTRYAGRSSACEAHVRLSVVRQRLAIFTPSPFRGALGVGVECVLVLAVECGSVLVPLVDDTTAPFDCVGILVGETGTKDRSW